MIDAPARPSDAPRARVLVIDDDDDVRRIYYAVLTHSGYETQVAPSAIDGLELAARGWRPDVILLDLMMPHVSGVEAVAVLKAHPTTRDATVVAFSAHIHAGDSERLLRLEFDDVMEKPDRPTDVLPRMATWLERREGSRGGS